MTAEYFVCGKPFVCTCAANWPSEVVENYYPRCDRFVFFFKNKAALRQEVCDEP